MSLDLAAFTGTVAIIAAAGQGSRMGSEVAKQYLPLAGRTVLEVTVEKFLQFSPINLIVLVVKPGDEKWHELSFADNPKIVVIDGGEHRANSVLNALKFLYDAGLPDHIPVLVHDAARPCVNLADIEKLLQHLELYQTPCMLGAAIVDTIQQVDDAMNVKTTVDRSNLFRAFTPQAARFSDLIQSLLASENQSYKVTDEVSALLVAGHEIKVIVGDSRNIKITLPEDLLLAEFYLTNSI